MATTEMLGQTIDMPRVESQPRAEVGTCGLPPEQVHAWLQQVQQDMQEVRNRIEFLRAEQSRLESQRRLLAELLTSSTSI